MARAGRDAQCDVPSKGFGNVLLGSRKAARRPHHPRVAEGRPAASGQTAVSRPRWRQPQINPMIPGPRNPGFGRRTPRSLSQEERQLNTTGPTFAELGHPERQAVLERLAVTLERTARWAEEGAGIAGLGNLELDRSEILPPDQSPMRGTECIIDRSLPAVGCPHHKGG